jgi:hypothetical protein
MEKVGIQVKLPWRRAFQIAVQGIRIRLGRSLVTVSGVVLGVAFLMSNVTAQMIRRGLAQERERRQTVNLMETLIRSEVGNVQGKRIGVAVFGPLRPEEEELLARLRQAKPAELRGFGLDKEGLRAVARHQVGREADLLLVLGQAAACPAPPSELTEGMRQKVVLDSVTGRRYGAALPADTRRVPFFGQESTEQLAKLRDQARQARFRTLWIALVSILVTLIGISNALLMSVTERFKEIGTMKCLGALSGFIRRLFLLESALIGLAGSLLGTALGVLIPIVAYGCSFHLIGVLGSLSYPMLAAVGAGSIALGTLMAMVAAIYPANFAAHMVPASALRSNV